MKLYNKIQPEMIKHREFRNKAEEIYEKEKGDGTQGCERFKVECMEAAVKTKSKSEKKREKKRKIIENLEDMKKLQR